MLMFFGRLSLFIIYRPCRMPERSHGSNAPVLRAEDYHCRGVPGNLKKIVEEDL
jgi:hypothetical protein